MNDLIYEVNGLKILFSFETSNHLWFIFKGSPKNSDFRNCLMRLTKVKGDTIIKFLELLKEETNKGSR